MTTTTKAATFIVKVRKKESHSHGMYIRNESVLQPRSQGPPSLRPLPLQGGGKMRKSGNEVARKYELSVNWQTIIFIHSPAHVRLASDNSPQTNLFRFCTNSIHNAIQISDSEEWNIRKTEPVSFTSELRFSLLTQDKKINKVVEQENSVEAGTRFYYALLK